MIKFHIIASGSKGNCCVVQSNNTTILIDCGYKIRSIKNYFKENDIKHFDAMLITHNHIDHIAQLKHFKHLPTISMNTIDVDDLVLVNSFDVLSIKDLKITFLPLSHDAENTMGFLFESNNESLVYICDTGYVSSQVKKIIKNKTYYILESNHDIAMLMNSSRSMHLKQRILSDTGHLSNESCATILSEVVGKNTKQVVLAHLSQDCNCEDIALATSRNVLANDVELIVAKQHTSVVGGHHD